MSDHDSIPAARVTLQMLYEKQLENEKLLIQLNERFAGLEDVPNRITKLEIAHAKMQWIEKIVYIALASGVGGLVTALFNAFKV